MNTKFYHYPQSRCGGYFIEDDINGLCGDVIIEAYDYNHANLIAESKGIYFNSFDCSCCGKRWYKVDENDGKDYPNYYSYKLEDIKKTHFRTYCYVHYLNDKIKKKEFNN